mgnify:CR=1 FL=1
MSDKNAFLRPYVETDAQYDTSQRNYDYIQRKINEFKDGVADGLIHGEKDENKSHHYYKQGYDYGVYLYGELIEKSIKLKIEENSE